MDLLLICNKSPWPAGEGGPIAMNAMVEGLTNAGHKVKVLAINSNKYHVNIDSIPAVYRAKTQIELVYIDLSIKVLPAFANLFTDKSYHVERFISDDFEMVLKRILQENHFDIIQLESLFICPYIPLIRQLSKAPIILRAHNIEHLIWKRLFHGERNPIKKWYLGHLASTLRKYELKAITEVDGIVAITPKDARYFEQQAPGTPVISIPYGITPLLIEKYSKQVTNIVKTEINETEAGKTKTGETIVTENNTIFHLGSMNWMPNQEGIKWFLKEVWPEVRKQCKNATFHLAGRSMPDWLLHTKSEGVVIDGEVADALNYMQTYRIMVVPLFSGSGIRIKIIEGMLAGCAVITTSIGAEGINYSNGKHLLLADSAQGFIDSIIRLLPDQQGVAEIGKQATLFINEQHNNQKLIEKLETFYRQQAN